MLSSSHPASCKPSADQALVPADPLPHLHLSHRRSADGLAAALGPEFELVQEEDMPVATRTCERMYSVAVMHATLWRRLAAAAPAATES